MVGLGLLDRVLRLLIHIRISSGYILSSGYDNLVSSDAIPYHKTGSVAKAEK